MTTTLSDQHRRLIECVECGEKRPNKSRGRCSRCVDRDRRESGRKNRPTAIRVNRDSENLTEQKIASLRRMIGWRPEWAQPEHPTVREQVERGIETRKRIVAYLAADGLVVTDRMPRGYIPQMSTALDLTESQIDNHILRLRREARTKDENDD